MQPAGEVPVHRGERARELESREHPQALREGPAAVVTGRGAHQDRSRGHVRLLAEVERAELPAEAVPQEVARGRGEGGPDRTEQGGAVVRHHLVVAVAHPAPHAHGTRPLPPQFTDGHLEPGPAEGLRQGRVGGGPGSHGGHAHQHRSRRLVRLPVEHDVSRGAVRGAHGLRGHFDGRNHGPPSLVAILRVPRNTFNSRISSQTRPSAASDRAARPERCPEGRRGTTPGRRRARRGPALPLPRRRNGATP